MESPTKTTTTTPEKSQRLKVTFPFWLKLLEANSYSFGLNLHTKNLIAATGARWRELNVPGEKEYLGSGVAFCPHCDGPFYAGKKIAVVGGGNSGVEAALDLASICAHVTIIQFGEKLHADQILLDKIKAADNIDSITMGQTLEIEGDGKLVTGLRYKDRTTDEEKTLELTGVFIQIGLIPNSTWIADHVETTQFGEIVVNERNHTSTEGIYAAGDVSTIPYKQIPILWRGSQGRISRLRASPQELTEKVTLKAADVSERKAIKQREQVVVGVFRQRQVPGTVRVNDDSLHSKEMVLFPWP